MRDLEIIIVLVLLACNFIPQRSHYSLTASRLTSGDSSTVTLTNAWGWNKSNESGVIGIPVKIIQYRKKH